MVEDAGRVLELSAGIVLQPGVLDLQGSAARVDHEEDGSASLACAVVAQDRAVDEQVVVVAVGVDRTTAAASRSAATCGVRAPADGLIAHQQAVGDVEIRVEAAQRAAIGADIVDKVVVGDVDGAARVHAVGADRRAAEVGTVLVAPVVEERGVDHRELAPLIEDGAAAVARRAVLRHGRVSVLERHVLHDELRPVLFPAGLCGVFLRGVAGIHVQDADLAAAAQRHLAAAIEHYLMAGVHDFGRGGHRDRDRLGAAVEGDIAALGDRFDHRGGRAAGGLADADDVPGASVSRVAGRRNVGLRAWIATDELAGRIRGQRLRYRRDGCWA